MEGSRRQSGSSNGAASCKAKKLQYLKRLERGQAVMTVGQDLDNPVPDRVVTTDHFNQTVLLASGELLTVDDLQPPGN